MIPKPAEKKKRKKKTPVCKLVLLKIKSLAYFDSYVIP